MSISFSDFLVQMLSSPMLAITVVLTLGVILVNGWTDAPNAIATCVSTRCMRAQEAIIMAAVFNFLGVLVMTIINSRVAMTIYNMVDFGGNTHEATVALCAALFAIVVWATAAWAFGIPTSESHALIAGLSGAAIGLHGSLGGINFSEWVKVIYGLVLSTCLVWYRLFDHPIGRSYLLQDGSGTNPRIFPGCPDPRRGWHGLYAWRPRWTEIHGRVLVGHFPGARAKCK